MSVEVYLLSYKQQVYQYIILYTVYIYIYRRDKYSKESLR